MPTRWPISRRTVLRGLGATFSLPWLEAMGMPAAGAEPRASRAPLRMVFIYHPLGVESTAWKGVTGVGKDLNLTPTLQPLEAVKEQILVLDGLNGRPHPSSGHNRSACLWLSGAPAGKADSWGVETDQTLDQLVATKLSEGARQKSLELSCTTIGTLMHAMNVCWRDLVCRWAPRPARAKCSPAFSAMRWKTRSEKASSTWWLTTPAS